jgi:hypothetical protein
VSNIFYKKLKKNRNYSKFVPKQVSVDIDLAFLPITPRDEALRTIGDALNGVADGLHKLIGWGSGVWRPKWNDVRRCFDMIKQQHSERLSFKENNG